jgi:pseudomonalisin
MELSAFATTVKALGCLIRGLTLAIAIVPASLAGTALAVDVNQHGLTGSWYNPAASGQGVEIEVYQDAIAPGIGYLHGSWATFSIGWEYGQRWYSFGGTVRTGQSSSTLEVFENTGGNFNAPPATRGVPIGTMVLTFQDCTTAVMEYQDLRLDGWGPFSGTFPLVRLTPNITCSVDGASRPDVDFSYSGHWFDPATPGQGLFVELNPIAEVFFVVWYTYAADGASQGTYGERWYTGLGKFVPGMFTLPMILYETTGGVIGGSTDPAFTIRTRIVGTATANFFDCHTAQLTFKFDGGSNAGASGTINLSRVGPTPAGCGPPTPLPPITSAEGV